MGVANWMSDFIHMTIFFLAIFLKQVALEGWGPGGHPQMKLF